MNLTQILTSTLLVSASALALHAEGELSWHGAKDTTLRRELITRQILATESMTFREGDQQMVSQRIFDRWFRLPEIIALLPIPLASATLLRSDGGCFVSPCRPPRIFASALTRSPRTICVACESACWCWACTWH